MLIPARLVLPCSSPIPDSGDPLCFCVQTQLCWGMGHFHLQQKIDLCIYLKLFYFHSNIKQLLSTTLNFLMAWWLELANERISFKLPWLMPPDFVAFRWTLMFVPTQTEKLVKNYAALFRERRPVKAETLSSTTQALPVQPWEWQENKVK